MAISARHQLLSDSWTADVDDLEGAISRFRTDRNVANKCEVVVFEIVGDGHLHVNVTHRHATKTVSGWQDQAIYLMGLFTVEDSVTRHRTR
jgi:hypothetical protein